MTEQGANRLRVLLESESLISDLLEHAPSLEATGLEDRAMAASERCGYEQCIKELKSLAQQVTQQPMTSPHLDVTKFEQTPEPNQS